jgi:hypothetical protein
MGEKTRDSIAQERSAQVTHKDTHDNPLSNCFPLFFFNFVLTHFFLHWRCIGRGGREREKNTARLPVHRERNTGIDRALRFSEEADAFLRSPENESAMIFFGSEKKKNDKHPLRGEPFCEFGPLCDPRTMQNRNSTTSGDSKKQGSD